MNQREGPESGRNVMICGAILSKEEEDERKLFWAGVLSTAPSHLKQVKEEEEEAEEEEEEEEEESGGEEGDDDEDG